MHRVLHITDPADPLAEKVRAVSRDRLQVESTTGDGLPGTLTGFDAVLVGDGQLMSLIEALSEDGPELVQLTRGHHPGVDVDALAAAGVTVAGASPVLAPYVARHAFGLAIAAYSDSGPRCLQPHEAITSHREDWRGSFAGTTVGIIGFGRVGRAAADLWKLVGATVIYADVRTAPHGSTEKSGARRSTLDLLLSQSDIVSLHVQWGPTSNPLVEARELRLMGRESILVNTADARLVDQEALVDALNSGRIRAALDVEDLLLKSEPGFVATPYTAARSEEADENVAEFVVANIEAALSGSKPDGVIEILDYPPAGDPAFWSSEMSPRVT